MSPVETATQLLLDTERKLRNQIEAAIAARDYEAAQLLAGWALRVVSILNVPSPSPSGDYKNLPPNQNSGRSTAELKGNTRSYPRFVREGDSLVKIGWSKKEKREYEHKASVSILRAVASTISRSFNAGKCFTADELLPVIDIDGREIPAYQTYLVLAWMRSLGYIEQNGRVGYRVRKDVDLTIAVQTSWNGLDQRQRVVKRRGATK